MHDHFAQLHKVHDGDTVEVVIDHDYRVQSVQWIRLKNVDAPELWEPGGPEARDYITNWFKEFGGRCLVVSYKNTAGNDVKTFDRYVGTIYPASPSQVSLNEAIVLAGLATWMTV